MSILYDTLITALFCIPLLPHKNRLPCSPRSPLPVPLKPLPLNPRPFQPAPPQPPPPYPPPPSTPSPSTPSLSTPYTHPHPNPNKDTHTIKRNKELYKGLTESEDDSQSARGTEQDTPKAITRVVVKFVRVHAAVVHLLPVL